jgi:tRNA 2-thiouridine synthesizing protein A
MVDARGHRCPVPTLRLRKALDAVGEGEDVVVLADDPLARIDLPHFAAANGHQVIELSVEAWGLRARVRKGRQLGT